MKPIKRAAILHDLAGVGKVGLSNILPVLSVMGIEPCPVPTYVLSTHTGGFGLPATMMLPDFPAEAGRHYKEVGISFHAILIGYLGSIKTIEAAKDFLNMNVDSYVVYDPIFADHGKCYSNFNLSYVEKLKKLIPYADTITPNYTEACLLTGEEYEFIYSKEKIEKMIKKLRELGGKNIVITSTPSIHTDSIGIALYDSVEDSLEYYHKEKTGAAYPGTGDLFSAVLTGECMNGKSLKESCLKAHDFVSVCISESSKYNYPVKEGVLLEKSLRLLWKES